MMKYASMLFAAVLCLVATACAADKLYTAHDPAWSGVWIWARPAKTPPVLDVDLRVWLEKRPGAFGHSLINRIMGNAAITGYRELWWRLDDGRGKMLFPAGEKSLRWKNWDIDFDAFDYPAAALLLADRMGMKLVLVSSTPEVAALASARYPGRRIAQISEMPGTRFPAERLTANPRLYLERRPVWFRRKFTVKSKPETAELCITANDSYRLLLDDTAVGSGSDGARAKTFDVAPLLTPGEHVILAEVIPGREMAGLLVNFRFGSPGKMTQIDTDLDWECRVAGWREWKPVISTGFEGAGARFRLKEPWKYPTKIESSVSAALPRLDAGSWSAYATGEKISVAAWRPDRFPAELELRLARPETVGEVKVKAADIDRFALEGFAGSQWLALTPEVAVEGGAAVLGFSPRRLEKLRLTAIGGKPGAGTGAIEIGRAVGTGDTVDAQNAKAAGKFWDISGKAASQLAVADSGKPFGPAFRFAITGQGYNAYRRFEQVSKGRLIVEFDFMTDAKGECFNLGVMPLSTGGINHDTSLIWLIWDSSSNRIRYYSDSWRDAAVCVPGRWHHLKLEIHLSGEKINTFDLSLDGGAVYTPGCGFRNPVSSGSPAGSLCFAARKGNAQKDAAFWIDNISIRHAAE